MTQKQSIIYLVEGDTAPDMPVRFTGLILSNYQSIEMTIERNDGARIQRAVVPDENDDELGFVTWQEGDLVEGDHEAEFEFMQSGKMFTLPAKKPTILRVRRSL
jgi:hypothetical protein